MSAKGAIAPISTQDIHEEDLSAEKRALVQAIKKWVGVGRHVGGEGW